MLKPDKITVHEAIILDNDNPELNNNYLQSCNSFNSSSSSYSSSIADSNSNTSLEKCRSVFANRSMSDDDLKNIKKSLVEERRKQRSNLKEKVLLKTFPLDGKGKTRIIGESKCKRFVKFDAKIGEGSWKIIYKGFDRTSCRNIAWCELKSEYVNTKQKQQAILKELDILMRLNHPNVVKYYSVLRSWWNIHNDSVSSKLEVKGLVIIEELMNEGTLKGMIKKHFNDKIQPIDISLVLNWWLEIINVLIYIHHQKQPPIVHRNLKLENCFIFMDPEEDFVSVKIGGFGLAAIKQSNSGKHKPESMTTENYLDNYDTKVDISSCGIMMLELITLQTLRADCFNSFQTSSKSSRKHLVDLIASVNNPLIREIIEACLHPVPLYRPTAEELREHPIFHRSQIIVEPCYNDLDKYQTIDRLVDSLNCGEIKPIIEVHIRSRCPFVEDPSSYSQFKTLVFSLDIYQFYKNNGSELISAVKSYLEDEMIISAKNVHQIDKLIVSIGLQIQYLIKLVIGERWRRLFDGYSNCPQMSTDGDLIDFKHSLEMESSIASVDEYNIHFWTIRRATKSLELEMENYNRESSIKRLPYFFNMYTSNKPIANSANDLVSDGKNTQNMRTFPDKRLIKRNHLKIDTSQNVGKSNEASLMAEKKNRMEMPNRKPSSKMGALEPNNNTIKVAQSQWNMGQTDNKFIPESNDAIHLLSNVPKSIPDTNVHFRHSSEPQFMYRTNRNNPVNALCPVGPHLHSGSFALQSESSLYPHIYQANQSQTKFHQDPNQFIGYVSNFNAQPLVGINHSQFYQHPSAQQQKFFNIIPTPFVPSQSNLINSSHHSIPSQAFSGIYSGLIYPQLAAPYTNSHIMHNTLQYTNTPVDHNNTRHQTVEPILTRSLPSIIGNVTVSSENVIAPIAIQTSMASTMSNRIPTISNAPPTTDISAPQRQILVPTNNVQKLNPMFMSTTRPVVNRSQPAISPVPPNSKQPLQAYWKIAYTQCNNSTGSQLANQPINDHISVPQSVVKCRSESTSAIAVSGCNIYNNTKNVVRGRSFSQVQEKSKSKRPKTRLKSKYLLRIIEITENPATSEVILVFEALLPMSTMRFSCTLNNEINSLDMSKFLGDNNQIPGELRKNDILESLVSTWKKMCHALLDDINSISLNEDYVFHPFTGTLVKFADCIYQMQISSDVYDGAQSSSAMSSQSSYLHAIASQFSQNAFGGRDLSRHASNEDLSMSMLGDHMGAPVTPDIIDLASNVCDGPKTMANNNIDVAHKKPAEPTRMPTLISKCACNTGAMGKDCCVQVPDSILSSVRQIIDKLQNPHTKGLIILPQPNETLLRNARILEIPHDHMFFGLPSDSSFHVVKGQRDKHFIIANAAAAPTAAVTESHKKCVYQCPNEGAVLLDATGHIQSVRNASLVVPHANAKSDIKQLPFELTHNHRNQSLDGNQIVSVLQSLTTAMHGSAPPDKPDTTFDSPVMLEPIQINLSTDAPPPIPTAVSTGTTSDKPLDPSQIQVEYVSLHYVHMPPKNVNTAPSKPELIDPTTSASVVGASVVPMDNMVDRDLPRQVRCRKISNESLDSVTAARNRLDHIGAAKMIVNNNSPIAIATVPRSVPVGPVLNQIPLQQRMPNVSAPHSGQFLLTAQNAANQMSPNLLIHNLTGVAPFGSPTPPGPTPVPVVANTQGSNTMPLALSNQNALGLNYPSQVVIPGSMLPSNQMAPIQHIQQQPNQRMVAPAPMPISSQHMQSMIGAAIVPPSYTNSLHGSTPIPVATSEQQHYMSVSHPPVNIRQMTAVAPSSFYESNMTDSNMRLRFNQPITTATQQTQSIHFIPYSNLVTTVATTNTQNPVIAGIVNNQQSKLVLSDHQPVTSPDKSDISQTKQPDSDSKSKTEQTIGRFVIRPVTDKT